MILISIKEKRMSLQQINYVIIIINILSTASVRVYLQIKYTLIAISKIFHCIGITL